MIFFIEILKIIFFFAILPKLVDLQLSVGRDPINKTTQTLLGFGSVAFGFSQQ